MKGFTGDIEKQTEDNVNFRQVVYTGKYAQLVVMSLKPSEEIGTETHPDTDQFLRIESGEGRVIIDGESREIAQGSAIFVPAGAEHNVVNTSSQQPLKLYTLYSPPHHKDGTVHATKEEAEADENDHI